MAYDGNKVINDLEAKATPVDADVLVVGDSADTNRAKKTTWSQIKTVLSSTLATIASPTFTGTVTTPAIIVSSETASTIASFDASKNIKSLALATYPSLTELTYVKGVTSALQTQLNAKAATLSGTNNEIAYFNSGSTIASLAVATYPSLTELSYVKGVTSALQTQLNALAATTYTNGSTTRDLSTASGNQTIAHGLGKTPKKIKITVIQANTSGATDCYSFGAYNGTTNSNVYRGQNSNNQFYTGGDDTYVINIFTTASTDTSPSTATATFDGTNITLAWTKATSATGTAQILWEAEG